MFDESLWRMWSELPEPVLLLFVGGVAIAAGCLLRAVVPLPRIATRAVVASVAPVRPLAGQPGWSEPEVPNRV